MLLTDTFTYRNATVTVRSDERFFTVRDIDSNKVLGTVIRPRALDNDRRWESANVEGETLGKFIGPRTSLIALVRSIQKEV